MQDFKALIISILIVTAFIFYLVLNLPSAYV